MMQGADLINWIHGIEQQIKGDAKDVLHCMGIGRMIHLVSKLVVGEAPQYFFPSGEGI